MATLMIISGPNEGQCYPLAESRLISVGRDDQCNIQIVDTQISRRHLQVRHEAKDDCHYAVDMRSANGVFVNSERITEEAPLTEGDVIGVGQSQIRYTRSDFPDAESAWAHFKKKDEWKRSTLMSD